MLDWAPSLYTLDQEGANHIIWISDAYEIPRTEQRVAYNQSFMIHLELLYELISMS